MAGTIPGSLETGGCKLLYPYTVDDATLTSSTVAEADYAAWASGTNYAAAARVIRTTTHRIYERVTQGVSTIIPEKDPTNWVDVGATLKWRMFDSSVGSQTTGTNGVTVTLNLGPVNDVVLLNVTPGATVTITKPGGSTVQQVAPAAATPGDGSILVFTDIAGATGTYTVAVTGTGTIGVGSLCMGKFISLGSADYGAAVGITDYSSKDVDSFGSFTLVKRDFSKRLTVPITLLASNLDQTVNILAAVRSTPCVWVGVQNLGSTIVYGFPKDWNLRLANPVWANGSITIEGLAQGNLPATGV